MRNLIAMLVLMLAGVLSKGQDKYDEFISMVSRSCGDPSCLLTTTFTNDVITYRMACSNTQGQCAADLALAISLMHRMDHDDACVASDECFMYHQRLVSNIVYCSGLEADSWIRYASAVEYMSGLNYGNQQDAAFRLSTNMVAKITSCPPNIGVTNYWDAMSSWMKSPHETLLTVFRLNAAIWLVEHNCKEEIVPLTNSLPASAINILQDELIP